MSETKDENQAEEDKILVKLFGTYLLQELTLEHKRALLTMGRLYIERGGGREGESERESEREHTSKCPITWTVSLQIPPK